MNILRTASLGSNYTGSYKKECTSTGRRKPLQCNQGSTLSFWWRYLFFQSESPFVYQVINKTKLSITNFQKQSPWNILIKESRSLNNTICTYNTPCIYFSFYLIIYLFIILFVGFASIIWKCEEIWCNSVIMKEISLDTLWNLNDPQILFQNLLSKNYWWKNTLSLSKVLIYYEIENFTKEVPLKFEDGSIFRFLYITLKIGLWYVSTISHHPQTAWKKAAWRVNTGDWIS